MTYLIVEIVLGLFLAFLLGTVIGWLLRSSSAKKREAFLEEDLRVGAAKLGDSEAELRRCKSRAEDADQQREQLSTRCVDLERQLAQSRDDVQTARAEITELSDTLSAKEQRITALEKELRGFSSRVPELESELEQQRAKLSDAEQLTSQHLTLIPAVEAERDESNAARDAAQQGLDRANSELETSQAELSVVYRERSDYKLQMDKADKELSQLRLLLASQTSKTESALQARDNLDAKLVNLQAASDQPAANSDQLAANNETAELKSMLLQRDEALANLQRELAACREACAEAQAPETQTSEAQAPAGDQAMEAFAAVEVREDDGVATLSKLFDARPAQVDDLKRIKGIGPKLEAMLNGLGIYQFEQIAGFTLKDLDWIDDKLNAFKGRAKRDLWVAQAKALA